ncbi:MAG: lipopolysaccharide biosynthesis protein [Bacillota bacterium]
MEWLKVRAVTVLRWSERYTKTDMVYLASGGIWLLLGQAVALGLSLLLAVAFGHLASQDLYGNYKYALSLAGVLGVFSLSGMSTAITHAIAHGRDGALRQGFLLNLRWSLGISILGIILALYYFYVGNAFAALTLVIIALLTPFLNSFALYDAFLVGKKEFGTQTRYNLVSGALTTAAIVGALFFTSRAIVIVLLYFSITLALSAYWYLRTKQHTTNTETDPELFKYSAHLSIMNVVGGIADKIDSIIIFNFIGPTQLAVYAYAIAMPEQIKAVVKSIIPLSMPKFAQRDFSTIRATIWPRVLGLTFGLAMVILVYVLAAPLIFHLLFPVYVNSIFFSQVYALSIIVTGFTAAFTAVLQAHKKTRELYVASTVGAIALIVSLPILASLYGILGAILSQVIYRVVSALCATWQFMRARD